jgi:hypothetical protein
MAVSLKENNWFFVTDQTPCPLVAKYLIIYICRRNKGWGDKLETRLFVTTFLWVLKDTGTIATIVMIANWQTCLNDGEVPRYIHR